MGDGGAILGIIPINIEDNVLHAVIGVGGVVGLAAARAIDTSRRRSSEPAK